MLWWAGAVQPGPAAAEAGRGSCSVTVGMPHMCRAGCVEAIHDWMGGIIMNGANVVSQNRRGRQVFQMGLSLSESPFHLRNLIGWTLCL